MHRENIRMPRWLVVLAVAGLIFAVMTPAAVGEDTDNAKYVSHTGDIYVPTALIDSAAVAAAVAEPGDGKFIQMGPESSITMMFPGGIYAVPDGTTDPDLRVVIWDAIYPAQAEVSVSYDGVTYMSLGFYEDTADIDLDLWGPVKYITIDQPTSCTPGVLNYPGLCIDGRIPLLGFDLDGIMPLNPIDVDDGGFVTGGGWFDSPAGSYSSALGPWFQGFESDTDGWFDATNGWYGSVDRVASDFGGVSSASGGYHAVMSGDETSAPYSTVCRDDRPTWPGTWNAEIDVWLDPEWSLGTGFDYTVAAGGSDGNHQRDFIFHVTKDSSTEALLVAGSNNTNFVPREDLDTLANHYEVTTAGWYTLRHTFYDDSGFLAVDLDLVDTGGNVLFTETRTTTQDAMTEIGGYYYSWFTFINVPNGIAADNHEVSIPFTCSTPTDLAGQATFGFVSKYKKGATVPTGSTEFQFHAGDLNFHSSSYDWLVVTGSDYAMFKGVGTINGEGEYKFRIWAGDDDPDTFRIKIWTETNDIETVVYDNGHDQPIGGGSIVVHTKKK